MWLHVKGVKVLMLHISCFLLRARHAVSLASIYANTEAMVAKHANLVFFHDGSIVWFHDKLSMPSIPDGDRVSQ